MTILIRKTIKDENRAICDEIDSIKKLRDNNDTMLSRLLDLYVDKMIDRDDYDLKKKEGLATRQKLVQQYSCFEAFDLSLIEKFDHLVKLLTNLSETYKTGDDTTKGYILKCSLVKLDIDDEKRLTVHEKEPFYWLSLINFQYGASDSTPVKLSPLMSLLVYLQKSSLSDIQALCKY